MNFRELIIPETYSAKEALQKLNQTSSNETLQISLFVANKVSKILGSITDGDIRRGLISGLLLEDCVTEFMFKNFKFLNEENFKNQIISDLKLQNIRYIPFLDNEGLLIKIIDLNNLQALLPLDAVIMAGGKGERLLPLTKLIPKPLLKIGNKPVIEHNVDRLKKFGILNYHISINYLGEKIEDFFGNGDEKKINISYVKESTPLGTIGSITLVNKLVNKDILVMNSDLLTNIDYADFYNFFVGNDADMAIASVPYIVNVPYAVFELTDNNNIKSIKEKPKFTYYSNAGIYIIKRTIIEEFIPKNEKFDATDLIEKLVALNKKVVSYPLTTYWLDIGRLDDFNKAQEDIKHIKFN